MECGNERLGQGQGKMGQLPQTIERAEADRSKELVVPVSLNDRLSVRGGPINWHNGAVALQQSSSFE
jgi:hypothetical protein